MSQVQECVEIISQHIKNFKPEVGLILGSNKFCWEHRKRLFSWERYADY